MKTYLSLIPISAKVHRRQNRMVLLCIVFSVFLVTAVFSMAEMGARMEGAKLVEKHKSLSVQEIFSSTMGQTLLAAGIVLSLLILIAGVLMISGSMNSSVAQRMKFFGMMRCMGMSKQQISFFVRLEALNWCKIAVPIGLGLGILASWILCAALRFLVGKEFSQIPLFGISIAGIAGGALVGVVTVLIASDFPAKRAAKVSPVTAACGNAESIGTIPGAVKLSFLKIETVLGLCHAVSEKKNLILMTASFALSIILFLSFSVMVDFVNYLMPQSASASHINIASSDGSNSIDCKILDAIRKIDGVKEVYGRRSCFKIPAKLDRDIDFGGTVDLVSFDDFDLDCLEKDNALKRGSRLQMVYGDSGRVLAVADRESDWKMGDRIFIGSKELEIAGLFPYDPFSDDGLTHGNLTLVVSGETFTSLTGISSYSLVMVQTVPDIKEENVQAIREYAGGQYVFSDKRAESTSGTYLAFVTCVYGFLFIIMMVTLLNIINSISMSVSARIRQYGAMRAVGMKEFQITKMIFAEAATYAFLGCMVGDGVGLLFSKLIYDFLITEHFPYAVFSLPVVSLLGIFLFVLFATAVAAYIPARRIRKLSVTETINEL